MESWWFSISIWGTSTGWTKKTPQWLNLNVRGKQNFEPLYTHNHTAPVRAKARCSSHKEWSEVGVGVPQLWLQTTRTRWQLCHPAGRPQTTPAAPQPAPPACWTCNSKWAQLSKEHLRTNQKNPGRQLCARGVCQMKAEKKFLRALSLFIGTLIKQYVHGLGQV